MPTSAGHKPSSNNAKGSNDRLSNIGACNTASSPHNINPTDEANAPLIYAAISAKCSDDGHALNHVRKRTAPIATPVANDGRAKDIDVLELGLTGSVPIGDDDFLVRLSGRAGAILDFKTDSRRLIAGFRAQPILVRSIGPSKGAFCSFGSYSDNVFGLPFEARCAIATRLEFTEVLSAGSAMFTDADELISIGGDASWEFRPRLLADGKPRDGLIGGLTYRYQRTVSGLAPDIDRIDATLKYRWWLRDLAVDFGLTFSDGTEPKSLVDENKIALTLGLTY